VHYRAAAAMSSDPEAIQRSDRIRAKKKLDKFIRGNPVFANPAYQQADQWGLTDDELMKFMEIYAIADPDCLGYLGQIQFKRLLALINVEVSKEQLDKMFEEMDENGDNQISFDEFVAAMASNLDAEQLEMASAVKPGGSGTRRWTRGEIVWAANKGIITIVSGMNIAACIYFRFILVPLAMAYFLMFLVAPLMNAFEFRPLVLKGKSLCDPYDPESEHLTGGEPKYKSEGRQGMEGKPQAMLFDCFTMCKMPHGVGVIFTLITFFSTLAAIGYLVYSELSVMLTDESFMNNLNDFVDGVYSSLNTSGVKILRPKKEGYTMEEINGYVSIFSAMANDAVLIFLLWIYLIAEKVNPTVFDCTNKILMEIENQAKNYIALKTVLSFITGLVVAIILLVIGVKLAVLWGILSFVLNFIPNVGSMIAMFLPMPVVIVDPGLSDTEKAMAFLGPGAVQGYVGNALEPMVFGKSLNMTPLSILSALVIWGSVWGLMGAILSVPLLGIQKILMQHTNHPMAKYCVMMIREDPTVDENAEI
jgi:AI-2 transport protein TqsA